MYAVAAAWLMYTVLAVVQWLSAEDSGGRWRAGVMCLLGLVLAVSYAVLARRKEGRSERD
jgi:hypothetical protein